MFDAYKDYQAAFYTAGAICAVALIAEMLAKRPVEPATTTARATV
jgi:hypothetical protein